MIELLHGCAFLWFRAVPHRPVRWRAGLAKQPAAGNAHKRAKKKGRGGTRPLRQGASKISAIQRNHLAIRGALAFISAALRVQPGDKCAVALKKLKAVARSLPVRNGDAAAIALRGGSADVGRVGI